MLEKEREEEEERKRKKRERERREKKRKTFSVDREKRIKEHNIIYELFILINQNK